MKNIDGLFLNVIKASLCLCLEMEQLTMTGLPRVYAHENSKGSHRWLRYIGD